MDQETRCHGVAESDMTESLNWTELNLSKAEVSGNKDMKRVNFKLFPAAAAKSLQLCLTLWDPIDGSPPGSPIPGILQARTLEWVTISFSNAWKWSRSVVSDSSRPHGLQPTRLLRPWDLPGKSTGVGCHCLLPSGHEFEQIPGDGEGQGSLACCSPWGCKE